VTKNSTSKLSFRAVEVFVSVVEEQGVTPAAKRLGASPSAVSLQLSNLEAVLGAKLIERSSQRFALTPAGELFHPRALRILDEISSASAVLSKSNVSPRMVLKISVIEDFDSMVVSPWLTAIRVATDLLISLSRWRRWRVRIGWKNTPFSMTPISL